MLTADENVAPPPELLAPAGDWESLRAAVANGADAVYFGLSNFNARHRATNFTLAELPEVMAYLHQRNVLGYVALNTLIFSDELTDAAEFVRGIVAAGADAVIVQDLGLVRLIHRLAPGLPIHGSTQMTLTEPRGIEFVRRLGVDRVILARELSVDDIRRITARTTMPVEVFVHGALCIAYSGQCLTSEALGGRSANRGQCAQACRLPYELIVDGKVRDIGDRTYLLSPQDLAAHDLIDPLMRLGVRCFKIEGRLKSAQYVAIASQTYRAAIDAALADQQFSLSWQGQLDLAQSFSRGFTPGFLGGIDHQRLVEGRFPKSRGVRIGIVVEKVPRGVIVEVADEHLAACGAADSAALGKRDACTTTLGPDAVTALVKPGDGVVFDEGHPEQDEQGGRVYRVAERSARRLELTFGEGQINLAALALGARVWKTDDPALRKRAEQSYSRDRVAKRQPVDFEIRGEIGGPLELIARDAGGREAVATWAGPLSRAERRPITLEVAREQLGRLGDTPFDLGEVRLELPTDAMVPKSVLNDLRRQAVAGLLTTQEGQRDRTIHVAALDELRASGTTYSELRLEAAATTKGNTPHMHILVRTMEQLAAVVEWRHASAAAGLTSSEDRPSGEGGTARRASSGTLIYCDFEDVRRYREAVNFARGHGQPIGLATLRILKPGEEGFLAQIAHACAEAVLIRNLAALAYFQDRSPHTALVGDFSLNVANELTADLFFREGMSRLVPSYDLNWEQLASMLKRSDAGRFEIVVHQHMPMFHMEHCVFAAMLSDGKDWRDCGRPCDRHQVNLRDRVGASFPLAADTGCRNTVFNSVAQSAAEFIPRMLAQGVQHFRVELLRESATDTKAILDRYSRVIAGLDSGRGAWRQLQVLNQLGVTRGTLASK
jgi:putative protease